MKNPEWQEEPVDVKTFIEDEYYLNIKTDCWECIKKDLVDFYTGDYREAVFDEAIGAGKSFTSSIITVYEVYKMLCLRNPQKYFHLAPRSKIAFMNMSLREAQARHIVFGNIKARIEGCQWFKDNSKLDPDIRSELRFLDKDVYIICGNSKSDFPAGYDIFGAIIDEAAWYLEKDGKSKAEEIYDTMDRRIKSRFNSFGKIIVISSPRYVDDYIERKFKEAETDSRIFARRRALWEAKPDYDLSPSAMFSITVRGREISIPNILKKDYNKNPEKFLRDYAAIPSLTLEPYIKDFVAVEACVKDIPNLWDGGKLIDKLADCKTPCFIHVDLALNKDACGFAMVTRDINIVRALLLAKIKAQDGAEISFSEVRSIIIALRSRGYLIEKVSYDGWQSIDSRQQLEAKGFNVEILSVDKTLEPYDTLKGLFYERRIEMPYFEQLMVELERLEFIKGKKVDHPEKGSKDIADALAGACFWAGGNEIYNPQIANIVNGKVIKQSNKRILLKG